MLICSFSPIQNRFFSRIIPSLHRSMPPSHTTTSAVGSSWSSWRGRWGMTVRRPWQRTGLAKIQRGLKGKRWTDNLVVWPTAASGSCTEMITQSSHLTSLPARPQGTASTDMGQSVCVCVGWGTWYGRLLWGATTVTSNLLFEGASSVLVKMVLLKANDINEIICLLEA